jgi:hypothetical protein
MKLLLTRRTAAYCALDSLAGGSALPNATPRPEVEVLRATFGVKAAGGGYGFEERGFFPAVFADDEGEYRFLVSSTSRR